MDARPKILLLDDDPDLLDMYRDILEKLPSQPELYTATNGTRAIKMLESEGFSLFICDLRMPKMDGLQVLSVVRRKLPDLRTVVLTSVLDEQFRSRVYALGVDLFWQKPATEEEIRMLLDCIESLLGREIQGGFRGVQSKSLVDIIQLECLSHSSSVLRITNGPLTGRLWILNGELVDAQAEELTGETAFRRILSWKAGNFEQLPADLQRPRTIFKSVNALLLELAQAQDELAQAYGAEGERAGNRSLLSLMHEFKGLEFVVVSKSDKEAAPDACGVDDARPLASWADQIWDSFRPLGDDLQVGEFKQVECLSPMRSVVIAPQGSSLFCVGWDPGIPADEAEETTRKVLAQWAS